MPRDLSTDNTILSILHSFDPFMVKFNMNKIEAIFEELVNMFTTFKATIKKEKNVFLVGSSFGSKKMTKGKDKKRSTPTKNNSPIIRQSSQRQFNS